MAWRFAPDVDPTTPGIYTSMTRLLPTPWGTYRTSPSRTTLGTISSGNTLGGFVGTSAIFRKTDGTTRWLVGISSGVTVQTDIYDSTDSGASFTLRSAWAGGASQPTSIQYGQYGDVTIAVGRPGITKSSSSGNFSDLSGSPPKANLICTQSNAVLLFDYDDGSNTYTDGWWASDIGDHTAWTADGSTEAANGRLLQTPGGIKCVIAFGGRVIAFKDNSIYEGQYVGKPVIWSWRVLHPSIGCSSPNGAATDGQRLFFYGQSGAYIYDGAQFTRVDEGVEKYLASNLTSSSVVIVYSSVERIFACDSSIAYCPTSGLWSVFSDTEPSSAYLFSFVFPVKIPPNFKRHVTTRTSSSPYTYSAHRMDGTDYGAVVSSVTTGWIGNDRQLTTIQKVIPQFVPAGDYSYGNGTDATYPAKLTLKSSAKRGGTMAEVTNSPVTIDTTNGRFNIMSTARWHEIKIEDMSGASSGMSGGMELAGIDVVSVPGGTD